MLYYHANAVNFSDISSPCSVHFHTWGSSCAKNNNFVLLQAYETKTRYVNKKLHSGPEATLCSQLTKTRYSHSCLETKSHPPLIMPAHVKSIRVGLK